MSTAVTVVSPLIAPPVQETSEPTPVLGTVGLAPLLSISTSTEALKSLPSPVKKSSSASYLWTKVALQKSARVALTLDGGKSTENPRLQALAVYDALVAEAKSSKKILYVSSPLSLIYQRDALLAAFKTGGTWVVDFSNFKDSQTIAELNGLFAKPPEFGGMKGHEDFSLVGIVNASTFDRTSDDFISRFKIAPKDFNASDLKITESLVVKSCQDILDATCIEFAGSPLWEQRLYEGVKNAKHSHIVLRHVPKECLDAIRVELAQLQKINPLLTFELQQDYRLKNLFTKTFTEPQYKDEPVLMMTPLQVEAFLLQTKHNDKKGNIVDGKEILAQSDWKRIRLDDNLSAEQVYALLNRPEPFTVEISRKKAQQLELPPPEVAVKPLENSLVITHQQLFERQSKGEDIVVYNVESKAVCLGDLIETMAKNDAGDLTFVDGIVPQMLKNGKTLVLQGLEKRPDLQMLLSGLTADKPYIVLNGKIEYVENRIHILAEMPRTPSPQMLGHYLTTFGIKTKEQNRVKQIKKIDTLLEKLVSIGGPYLDNQTYHARYLELFKLIYTYGKSPNRLKSALEHEDNRVVLHLLNGVEDKKLSKKLKQGIVEQTGAVLKEIPHDEKSRIAFCVETLKDQRGLFFVGPVGGGKSYTADKVMEALGPDAKTFALNTYQRHSNEFIESLKNWAKTKSQKGAPVLLFVDEANLAEENYWSILNTVFSPSPYIIIANEYIPLTKEHCVLFAGNGKSLAGRTKQSVIDSFFTTVTFPEISAAETETFVKNRLIDAKLPKTLAPHLLAFQQKLNQRFPKQKITPRHLLSVISRTQAEVRGGAKDIEDILLRNAMEVCTGKLNFNEQEACWRWLKLKYGHAIDRDLQPVKLTSKKIADVASATEFAQKVERHLRLLEQPYDNKSLPLPRSLIIEGEAGSGKDDILQEILEKRGLKSTDAKSEFTKDNFIAITAEVGGFKALLETIRKAAKVGAVVIISEINIFPPGLLESLNNILTAKNVHPNFLLISTVNPARFSGRENFTEAFLSRSCVIRVRAYDHFENTRIIGHFLDKPGKPCADVKAIAEYHYDVKLKCQTKNLPTPTTRQLVNAAELYKDGVPWKKACEQTYQLYEWLAERVQKNSRTVSERFTEEYVLQLLWPLPGNIPQLCEAEQSAFSKTRLAFEGNDKDTTPELLALIALAAYAKPETASDLEHHAKECCDLLCAQFKIADATEIYKHAQRIITLQCGKGPLPELKPPLEGPLQEQTTIRSALDEKPRETKPYGKFIKNYSNDNYFRTAFFSYDGTRIEVDITKQLEQAELQYGSSINEEDSLIIIQVNPQQFLKGFPVLFHRDKHVPFVEAVVEEKGVQSTIKQFGKPELSKDAKIISVKYAMMPIEQEDLKISSDNKNLLPVKEIPKEIAAILPKVSDTAPTVENFKKFVEWFKKKFKFCNTLAERQQALRIYGTSNPSVAQILQHALGVCADINVVIAVVGREYFDLEITLENGVQAENNGDISSEGHTWTKFFNPLMNAWEIVDGTQVDSTESVWDDSAVYQASGGEPTFYGDLREASSDKSSTQLPPGLLYRSFAPDVLPSSEPSRDSTFFQSVGDKKFCLASGLAVLNQPKTLVLASHSALSSTGLNIDVTQKGAYLLHLMACGCKVFGREADGRLVHLTSERDVFAWGVRLKDYKPSATELMECQQELGNSALVLSFDQLNTFREYPASNENTKTPQTMFDKLFALVDICGENIAFLEASQHIGFKAQALPFSLLTVAIIAKNIQLFDKLLELNYSLHEKDTVGLTPYDYLTWFSEQEEMRLKAKITVTKVPDKAVLSREYASGFPLGVMLALKMGRPMPEFVQRIRGNLSRSDDWDADLDEERPAEV